MSFFCVYNNNYSSDHHKCFWVVYCTKLNATLSPLRCSHVCDRASEQENVGFWAMYHVVHPSLRLLDSYPSPLVFCHQTILGNLFHVFFGEHHMSNEEAKKV